MKEETLPELKELESFVEQMKEGSFTPSPQTLALAEEVVNNRTFVESFLVGEMPNPEEEFNRLVELWHSSEKDKELHEFLGFTWEEYSTVVEDFNLLPVVLMWRRDEILSNLASHIVHTPLGDLER